MKIAFLGVKGLPSKGGAERVVQALVQQLAERHTVTVYCSARYTPVSANVDHVHLVRLPALQGKYSHMTSFDMMSAAHAVLFGDYDVVHLHNIEASFVLPLLKLRYKVVATAHGRAASGNKWGPGAVSVIRAMEWVYAHLSDARTSVALHDAHELEARFRRSVVYIPNGIDMEPTVDTAGALAILSAARLRPQNYILFSAGRILPLKGAHLLLEAFSRIQTEIPLVIVGDLTAAPEYGAQLQALADRRVIFIPFVHSPAVLNALLQLSSVFVFPSVTEGMSMSLLEAAAVGAPILCSDIPANYAVLASHAQYFRSNDASDLCVKLAWALDHLSTLGDSGRAGQAWVQMNFNWTDIMLRYEQVYLQVARDDTRLEPQNLADAVAEREVMSLAPPPNDAPLFTPANREAPAERTSSWEVPL